MARAQWTQLSILAGLIQPLTLQFTCIQVFQGEGTELSQMPAPPAEGCSSGSLLPFCSQAWVYWPYPHPDSPWAQCNNQDAWDRLPSSHWCAERGGFPLPEWAWWLQKSRCAPVTWKPSHLCWPSQQSSLVPLPTASLMFKHVEVMS